MFEREKRVASVHRRKREKYLAFVPVTGKGRESEKALWRRAKHKSAVMWAALRGEDHTPLELNLLELIKKRLAPISLSYQVQGNETQDEC
jgi:hypothetical protein